MISLFNAKMKTSTRRGHHHALEVIKIPKKIDDFHYLMLNFPAVHTIVNNWTSACLLVSRAKDAINVEGLVSDLVKINQYRTLAANVEFLEGSACTITKAYGLLKNMQFDDDPCAIKDYINKRLSNSDLETIINCTNLTIDPTSYALLQKAQPTSAAVERSFFMLK